MKIIFKHSISFFILQVVICFCLCSKCYAILDQKKVDEYLRKEILYSFSSINSNWIFFSPGMRPGPVGPSEYWKVIDVETRGVITFRIVWTGVGTLSKALDDIVNIKVIGDCSNAIRIVKLCCLRKLIGADRFDELVSKTIENLSHRYPGEPILYLNNMVMQQLSFYLMQEGKKADVFQTAFVNIPDYLRFKPEGRNGADNVMCVGPDQYIGFGPDLYNSGTRSEAEIKESFYLDFVDSSGVSSSEIISYMNSPYRNREAFFRHLETLPKQATYYFSSAELERLLGHKLREEKIGPRSVPGMSLHDVEGDGNCFFRAMAYQLVQNNHSIIDEIPTGTELHDLLRLRANPNSFIDGEYAGHNEIIALARALNIVVAIIDTRHPELGFVYHYINPNDEGNFTQNEDLLDLEMPIIRLAYTGDHYLAVDTNVAFQQAPPPPSFVRLEGPDIVDASNLFAIPPIS